MDLEHERRLRADRLGVVGQVHPVRRADLSQPYADRLQELRDPEPVADLDQFAPGDHDLPSRCERAHRQREGGGAVVHDMHGLGIGHGAGQRRERTLTPTPTRTGLQVELDVGGAGGGDDRLDRRGRERSPAEVGVHDAAGGVDDPAQRRRGLRERGDDDVHDALGRHVAGAAPVEDDRHRSLHEVAPEASQAVLQPRVGQDRVDPRRTPAWVVVPARSCGASSPEVLGFETHLLLGGRAEADGNRTRLTGIPGHYGVEDRARHQTRNASAHTLRAGATQVGQWKGAHR